MPLSDFFRINMPYGITRNTNNEWMAFNREYMPLGWNSIEFKASIQQDNVYGDQPIYTKYGGLTEQKLLAIAGDGTIQRDAQGRIERIFLYSDKTNPQTSPEYWPQYIDKIKKLSRLKIAREPAL